MKSNWDLTILTAVIDDDELVEIIPWRPTDQRQDRSQQYGTRLIVETYDNTQLGVRGMWQLVGACVAAVNRNEINCYSITWPTGCKASRANDLSCRVIGNERTAGNLSLNCRLY